MTSNLVALATTAFLAACTTAAQRKAAENKAIQKQAAAEIARICALPKAERQAEIDKIKEESGMVLMCGKD